MIERGYGLQTKLFLIMQGMISIKTLSKLAQLRHEGVVLVRTKPLLALSGCLYPEYTHSVIVILVQ